jgi:hypothetical protein
MTTAPKSHAQGEAETWAVIASHVRTSSGVRGVGEGVGNGVGVAGGL